MIQEKQAAIKKLKNDIERIVDHWGFTEDTKIRKITDVNEWLCNLDVSEIPIIYHLLVRIDLQRDVHENTCLLKIIDGIKKDFGNDVNQIKMFPIGDNAASSGG